MCVQMNSSCCTIVLNYTWVIISCGSIVHVKKSLIVLLVKYNQNTVYVFMEHSNIANAAKLKHSVLLLLFRY